MTTRPAQAGGLVKRSEAELVCGLEDQSFGLLLSVLPHCFIWVFHPLFLPAPAEREPCLFGPPSFTLVFTPFMVACLIIWANFPRLYLFHCLFLISRLVLRAWGASLLRCIKHVQNSI